MFYSADRWRRQSRRCLPDWLYCFTRTFRGGNIQFVGQDLHVIVGHGDLRAAECVGFDDVGAGIEILFVYFGDDVGLRDAEQVVIAFDIGVPVGKAFAAIVGFSAVCTAGSWCPWRHR